MVYAFPTLFGGSIDHPDLAVETVKKAPFLVSVSERGSLASLKSSTLTSNVEGTTTIIAIVPEGAVVKMPVPSKNSGTVIAIKKSGDDRTIVVQSDPVILHVPWAFVAIDGFKIEHPASFGKYTQLLVSEGDLVSTSDLLAGDVVCELDSSPLVDKEKGQQIAVTQAEADLEKSSKNVEIQLNQNQSDIAKAELALDLAQLDLRKFIEGEQIQQENESKGDVLIAQEELTQYEETYDFTKRLSKKGYKSQVELETARVAVVKARNKLAIAEEKLKVLQNYTFERTYKELKENAAETRRDLKRVRLSGLAALAQYQAELKARHLTYSVEKEKLRRLQRQIKACKLVAPQDGKVVYAKQQSRREAPVVIEEGTTVRERQRIIDLPDFSQMKVEAKIHESKISNVREGMQAEIRIDAIPDRVFNGVVETVPDVPVPGQWPNTDMMLYETMVRITDDVSTLKPGMNANIKIIAEKRSDVLQTPVQSIVAIGDSYIAYVLTKTGPELRKNIKIGKSNDKMVEILSGLEDGDQVVMNPKSQFSNEINALRSAFSEKPSKPGAKTYGGKKYGGKKPSQKKKGSPNKKQNRKRPAGGDPLSFFKRMDKNGDGVLTKEETPGQMKSRFSSIDANGDGKITPAEFSTAMKAFSRGGGRR